MDEGSRGARSGKVRMWVLTAVEEYGMAVHSLYRESALEREEVNFSARFWVRVSSRKYARACAWTASFHLRRAT